jgi:hypothetical protein
MCYVLCAMCYVLWCGMWYVVCGMWYVVCGVWCVVCRLTQSCWTSCAAPTSLSQSPSTSSTKPRSLTHSISFPPSLFSLLPLISTISSCESGRCTGLGLTFGSRLRTRWRAGRRRGAEHGHSYGGGPGCGVAVAHPGLPAAGRLPFRSLAFAHPFLESPSFTPPPFFVLLLE